jgi:hypothetical protein
MARRFLVLANLCLYSSNLRLHFQTSHKICALAVYGYVSVCSILIWFVVRCRPNEFFCLTPKLHTTLYTIVSKRPVWKDTTIQINFIPPQVAHVWYSVVYISLGDVEVLFEVFSTWYKIITRFLKNYPYIRWGHTKIYDFVKNITNLPLKKLYTTYGGLVHWKRTLIFTFSSHVCLPHSHPSPPHTMRLVLGINYRANRKVYTTNDSEQLWVMKRRKKDVAGYWGMHLICMSKTSLSMLILMNIIFGACVTISINRFRELSLIDVAPYFIFGCKPNSGRQVNIKLQKRNEMMKIL